MSISEKQDEKVIGKQRIMGEAETEEHLLAYAEKDYACWLMQRKTTLAGLCRERLVNYSIYWFPCYIPKLLANTI